MRTDRSFHRGLHSDPWTPTGRKLGRIRMIVHVLGEKKRKADRGGNQEKEEKIYAKSKAGTHTKETEINETGK
jgi:hypothetical protein